MKIRKGFVSNSSSSSFVIFGNKIEKDDLRKAKNPIILGNYLSEGRDYVQLTDEKINLIEKFGLKNGFNDDLFDSFLEIEEYTNEKLSKNNFPEGTFEVIVFEKDQHSTEDLEDFINIYIKDPRK